LFSISQPSSNFNWLLNTKLISFIEQKETKKDAILTVQYIMKAFPSLLEFRTDFDLEVTESKRTLELDAWKAAGSVHVIGGHVDLYCGSVAPFMLSLNQRYIVALHVELTACFIFRLIILATFTNFGSSLSIAYRQ